MQRRGQISFEYILLFSIVLLLFIAIGTITAAGINKTKLFERDAQRFADQIKVNAIAASLAQSDFSVELELPSQLGRKEYYLQLFKQDALALIKIDDGKDTDLSNDPVLGRVFLPVLSDISLEGAIGQGDGIQVNPGDSLVFKRRGTDLIIDIKEAVVQ